MCLSIIGQIAFGALMLVCLGLTVGSMFSPGWREYNNGKHSGIITGCYNPNDYNGQTTPSPEQENEKCKEWWNSLADWEKAVVVMLILALILELITIGWTIASFCACCCRSHFLKVLPPLAFLTTLLLAVAIIIFGVKHKDDIQKIDNGDDLDSSNSVSYSFYLGIGAILVGVAATIVGSITAFCSSHCL
ncbi:hypothetical protein FO519_000838 [Halicephalobus sp. NKZ332]|nr:hypothetical protein FO519_000838 [Halicephalobus sp. NKZ332]